MGRKKKIDDTTLLEHARAVFLEHGAFGSTRDIAERAGISEAAIFKRYPTKTGLFIAAMMPREEETDTCVASEIPDTKQALVETGYRLLKHFRAVIPTAMHLATHPMIKMADIAEQFGAGRVDRMARQLAAFLSQRQADGLLRCQAPLASANLMIAAIHSLAVYEVMEFHQGEDLGHAVPHFVNALWSGLAPRPEDDEPDQG